jgi:RND family efflux transporter MFP subunit
MSAKKVLFISIPVVVVLAVVAIVILKPPPRPGQTPPEGRAALNVELARPQAVQWPDAIGVSGPVTAWQEAIIASEVSGLRLAEVLVNVGDTVKKGQLLARFDDETTVAELDQQKAARAEAEANLSEAEANETRATTLHKTGSISEQDLKQYETRAQTARAQIESARARLRVLELKLKYTRVVAPDDGVISSRMATMGSVANPGSELFRLVLQNRLEWRPELTAAQLALVRPGQSATLRLPDGSNVTGKVRQLAPTLDCNTRTAMAYVDLDGHGAGMARAGMYASGSIILGERQGLAIPGSSVVVRDGYEYVFVVGADRRAVQTRVVTGRRNGTMVEASSGIEKDHRVVVGGVAFLNDGDLVSVVESSREGRAVTQ